MKRRDIVLISIPFTDLSERKIRPALVLSVIQEDLLCCFVSSNLETETENDVAVTKDSKNHLKVDSVIKCGKLFTLHQSLVEWKIGKLDEKTYQSVARKLTRLIA